MTTLLRHGHGAQVAQTLALGRRKGWDFVVLGRAPLPVVPVQTGDWLIVPVQESTCPMPERTLRRIEALYASGVRPKGFVVVHEAPKLLPASIERSPSGLSTRSPAQRRLHALRRYLPAAVAVGVLLVVGAGTLAMLLAVVVGAVAVIAVGGLLVGAAIVLDPILVAVMEDGTWVEIDRWWLDEGGG